MIPDGLNRVICSKCGEHFQVDKLENLHSPEECPSCGCAIIELIVPNDGSRIIAIVSEE